MNKILLKIVCSTLIVPALALKCYSTKVAGSCSSIATDIYVTSFHPMPSCVTDYELTDEDPSANDHVWCYQAWHKDHPDKKFLNGMMDFAIKVDGSDTTLAAWFRTRPGEAFSFNDIFSVAYPASTLNTFTDEQWALVSKLHVQPCFKDLCNKLQVHKIVTLLTDTTCVVNNGESKQFIDSRTFMNPTRTTMRQDAQISVTGSITESFEKSFSMTKTQMAEVASSVETGDILLDIYEKSGLTSTPTLSSDKTYITYAGTSQMQTAGRKFGYSTLFNCTDEENAEVGQGPWLDDEESSVSSLNDNVARILEAVEDDTTNSNNSDLSDMNDNINSILNAVQEVDEDSTDGTDLSGLEAKLDEILEAVNETTYIKLLVAPMLYAVVYTLVV